MGNKIISVSVGALALETTQLILRPPSDSEIFGTLQRWWERDRWAREYMDQRHSFADPTDLREQLKTVKVRTLSHRTRAATRYLADPVEWISLAVFKKDAIPEGPIGVMVLYDFNWYHNFVSLRSFISRQHRRMGYGRESTIALLEFLFEELVAPDGTPWWSAEAWWMKPNAGSYWLYTHCGFRRLSDVLEGRVRIGERRFDMVISQFTRPTWEEMKRILGKDFDPRAPRWQFENRERAIANVLREVADAAIEREKEKEHVPIKLKIVSA